MITNNLSTHTDEDKQGQMPMKYAREFYFYTYGKL